MKHDKFLQQLGRRIAKVRNAQGISQDELAEVSGVARSQIYRIEMGISDPRALTLVKIAKSLGVSVKEFFDGG